MKTTIDIHDAHMTLAVIASEHYIPYKTVDTASQLIDFLAVPPDIYILDIPNKDLALELIYEMSDSNAHLKFTVRERSINIIDNMGPAKPEVKYAATFQDCINAYKKHHEKIKEQFSFYEESF